MSNGARRACGLLVGWAARLAPLEENTMSQSMHREPGGGDKPEPDDPAFPNNPPPDDPPLDPNRPRNDPDVIDPVQPPPNPRAPGTIDLA